MFALELCELARKSPAELILTADELAEDTRYVVGVQPMPSRWAADMQRLASRRDRRTCARRAAIFLICCLLPVSGLLILATRRRTSSFDNFSFFGTGLLPAGTSSEQLFQQRLSNFTAISNALDPSEYAGSAAYNQAFNEARDSFYDGGGFANPAFVATLTFNGFLRRRGLKVIDDYYGLS